MNEEEIFLVNYLKALFNSVRSTSLHVTNEIHAVPDASRVFLLERVSLCEKSVVSLKKINAVVKKTVVKGLNDFRNGVNSVSANAWQRLFEETVVQPFEKVLLQVHSTKEGKMWVKTCLIIFRK